MIKLGKVSEETKSVKEVDGEPSSPQKLQGI